MKGESEEFRSHTHPIYLAFPPRQKQKKNCPQATRERKTDRARSLCQICFPLFPPPTFCSFLFPLALFFKVTWAQWQSAGVLRQPEDYKLSRPAGILRICVFKATSCADSQWQYSSATYSKGSPPQFEMGEICFWKAALICSRQVTSCLVKQSGALNTVYVNTRLREQNPGCLSCWFYYFTWLWEPLAFHSYNCDNVQQVTCTPPLPCSLRSWKSWGLLWTTC